MTTAEFIKILQEADPSGTAHIRMSGGIPRFAELKEGYWDGPYSYLDEEGRWVYSTEGCKVDIHCEEVYDYVSEMVDTYRAPSWEEIEKRFIFKLGYSIESQRKERENRILDQAREAYNDSMDMYKKFKEEGESRALFNSHKGWTWFQNKLVDDQNLRPNMHHYYTWIVLDENGKDQGSNPHNVEAVYKSGLFERHDNEVNKGYYQWIKK